MYRWGCWQLHLCGYYWVISLDPKTICRHCLIDWLISPEKNPSILNLRVCQYYQVDLENERKADFVGEYVDFNLISLFFVCPSPEFSCAQLQRLFEFLWKINFWELNLISLEIKPPAFYKYGEEAQQTVRGDLTLFTQTFNQSLWFFPCLYSSPFFQKYLNFLNVSKGSVTDSADLCVPSLVAQLLDSPGFLLPIT